MVLANKTTFGNGGINPSEELLFLPLVESEERLLAGCVEKVGGRQPA